MEYGTIVTGQRGAGYAGQQARAGITIRSPGEPLRVVSDMSVQSERKTRARRTWVGAGIGALAGLGVGVVLSLPSGIEGSMIPPPLIIGGAVVVGAALGAVIGALVPGH